MSSPVEAPPFTIYKQDLAQAVFPAIEAWENLHSDRNTLITIEVPEFTSVCPKTGLPDFGTLTVCYIPDTVCIELKAFKYYTLAYRNVGIFYENVVNKVLTDIIEAVNPRYLMVTGSFLARGGITTQVKAHYQQPSFNTAHLAPYLG